MDKKPQPSQELVTEDEHGNLTDAPIQWAILDSTTGHNGWSIDNAIRMGFTREQAEKFYGPDVRKGGTPDPTFSIAWAMEHGGLTREEAEKFMARLRIEGPVLRNQPPKPMHRRSPNSAARQSPSRSSNRPSRLAR